MNRKRSRRNFFHTTTHFVTLFGLIFVDLNFSDAVSKRCVADVTPVIDAYQHAVLGRFPRARYLVGSEARLSAIIHDYLPECLSDAFLTMYSLKQVPAALEKKIN